jgi:hypothetical protein
VGPTPFHEERDPPTLNPRRITPFVTTLLVGLTLQAELYFTVTVGYTGLVCVRLDEVFRSRDSGFNPNSRHNSVYIVVAQLDYDSYQLYSRPALFHSNTFLNRPPLLQSKNIMATISLSWFTRTSTSDDSSDATLARDELQLLTAPYDRRLAFQQVEDPSVYLVADGPYATTSQTASKHIDEGENKILAASRGFSQTGSAAMSGTSPPEGYTPPLKSPVISLGRFGIAKDRKAAFDEEWNGVKEILEDFVKPYSLTSGWAESDSAAATRNEFIMIAGWPSVQRHVDFASTEGFAEYAGKMRGFMEETEIKHYIPLV